jgi:NAD(P)-dependent dehydrogenase (short-subunit alcohol dehydrogenase family)
MRLARFEGQVVAVTGGNSGIGAEAVRCFAAEGASVLVAARETRRGAAIVAEVERSGGKAIFIEVDLQDPAACQAVVDRAMEAFGRLDALVNSAGIALPFPFLEMPLDLWHQVMNTNLTATFLCSQAAARVMVRQNHGRIVNLSSQVALLGNTERAAYSAAKGAILSLSRTMAVELAQYGITVNCIAPGAVATPMTDANHSAERRQLWAEAIPLGRYGTPADVASAILFLCSREADYITGQTLAVDGGFSIRGLMMKTIQRGPTKDSPPVCEARNPPAT